jgi:hypothetical protein
MSLVLACTFVGASLKGIFYAIPDPDIGEPWPVDVAPAIINFAQMFSPAVIGLVLARLERSSLGGLRLRGRRSPR